MRFEMDHDKFEDAAKSGNLRIEDIDGIIEFSPRAERIHPDTFRRMPPDVIDPKFRASEFCRRDTGCNFRNDYERIFSRTISKYKNYDNPLDFLEMYAIYDYEFFMEHRSYPYFFDPISVRVKIDRIVGQNYFLSDNGFVCRFDCYKFETDELKIRRKYILL